MVDVDWSKTVDFLCDAEGIAWDGCHKIYVLMDVEQVRLIGEYGYDLIHTKAEMSDDEMLSTVQGWFEGSCGLRFVQAVRSNPADPNLGFVSLIAQGEYDFDEEDEE